MRFILCCICILIISCGDNEWDKQYTQTYNTKVQIDNNGYITKLDFTDYEVLLIDSLIAYKRRAKIINMFTVKQHNSHMNNGRMITQYKCEDSVIVYTTSRKVSIEIWNCDGVRLILLYSLQDREKKLLQKWAKSGKIKYDVSSDGTKLQLLNQPFRQYRNSLPIFEHRHLVSIEPLNSSS